MADYVETQDEKVLDSTNISSGAGFEVGLAYYVVVFLLAALLILLLFTKAFRSGFRRIITERGKESELVNKQTVRLSAKTVLHIVNVNSKVVYVAESKQSTQICVTDSSHSHPGREG